MDIRLRNNFLVIRLCQGFLRKQIKKSNEAVEDRSLSHGFGALGDSPFLFLHSVSQSIPPKGTLHEMCT